MTPKERSWGSVLEPGADQLMNRCFYASRQSGRRLDRTPWQCRSLPHDTARRPHPQLIVGDLQDVSMGGTGLEPVTPSLSRWCKRSRPFAPVRLYRSVECDYLHARTLERTR